MRNEKEGEGKGEKTILITRPEIGGRDLCVTRYDLNLLLHTMSLHDDV
ncbi:hypothetical protein GCM10025794_36420 [Massilia kyonggiensis]|jgi:hypothetical protein